MNHQIRIEPAGAAFAVRGAISVPASKAPIIDAAKALKAANASDSDVLVVAGSVITVSPVTIGKVLDYQPSAARRAVEHLRYTVAPRNNV